MAFIEQHDPLFLALDMEQLSDFSIEHSFVDFASIEHLSIDAFLTFEAFMEQHEPDFADVVVAFVPHDSPPAKTITVEAKRALIDKAIWRIFMEFSE